MKLRNIKFSVFLQAELRQLGQNVADAITAAETLEIEIEDLQNTCQRLKENICRQEEAKEKIKEDAMSSCVALQNISTSIAHQRKLLYLITRLTWDEKAFKKNLIKGYVFDHVRNDVAVFETDAKKTQQNCSTMVSDFLWDYIGGGVNPAWKKQQK
jgi:seryl-tRNA synthetase